MGGFLLRQMEKKSSLNLYGIEVEVKPDVFNPRFFTSSKLLIEQVEKLNNVKGKSSLELGCGSGVATILAAKKGMQAYASDINSEAVNGLLENASKNGVEVSLFVSDLFNDIPQQTFDYLLINPPFYPKDPTEIKDNRWFCGADFEYFKRLFPALERYINADSTVWMTLSDDCELQVIQDIAKSAGWEFDLKETRKQLMEINYLFQLKRIN
jgi:release factor glutamine methyltransferase